MEKFIFEEARKVGLEICHMNVLLKSEVDHLRQMIKTTEAKLVWHAESFLFCLFKAFSANLLLAKKGASFVLV